MKLTLTALLFTFCLPISDLRAAEPLKKDALDFPPSLTKLLPESLDDLRAIQEQTKKVLEKVIPCTVGVQIGGAAGSGVIVSKDGYVLTAGHVSGKPGQKCTIILHDGTKLAGKSLGRNENIDSGMFKITAEGEWPFVEMGKSSELKTGQWCIATGHPNGYEKGRPPVVRLGRVLSLDKTSITTDCSLVGGDSGGPLFDLHGKVMAIHSRIGRSIHANVHVPSDVYRDSWDKLAKGDEIVPMAPIVIAAYFGVGQDEDSKECKLARVTEGSPAEKAGLKAGDIITKFDGKTIKNYDDLLDVLKKKKPGEEVEVIVDREGEIATLTVKLDKR